MDFFEWLRSAWPVLVPTCAVVIAYIGLKRSSVENRSQNKDVSEQVKNLVSLSEARMRLFIDDRINGKLERIDSNIGRIDDRLGNVERTVSALDALLRRNMS